MTRRISVVTGGARGIGFAIAHKLAAYGDQVVVADIQADLGRQSAETLNAFFFPVDVGTEKSVSKLVATVEEEVGPIHIWVNSAGLLQAPQRTETMPMEEHDRIWQINYRGTYLCCRAVAPCMAERGKGTILNIGSTNSFRIMPLPAYSPSKAAIKALTELLAAEWGPRGVRINTVAPGFARTPAFQAQIDSGQRDLQKIAATTALGRLVEPDEVADTALFLCSDQASAITGVCLPVDCGWLPTHSYNAFPR